MGNETEVNRGRMAVRPKEIPRVGWADVASRVRQEIATDNLSIVAAGMAFYGLLAVFPALAALVSLYGLFTDPQSVEQHVMVLENILPEQARSVVEQQLRRVTAGGDTALGIGAIVAFLLALWSSAKGVKSLMAALNVVYDEQESRGFFKLNVTALLLTLVMLLFALVALAAIAVLPAVLELAGLPALTAGLARWLRWPLLALLCLGILAVVYRYAASRARPRWRWVGWGALVATVLWLIGSALFSWYVSSFGSYNETYGSVAAIAVLMMWFWLSSYVVLLGGELNAEMEHQTRRDTTTGKSRPLGERGAYVADTVGKRRRARR